MDNPEPFPSPPNSGPESLSLTEENLPSATDLMDTARAALLADPAGSPATLLVVLEQVINLAHRLIAEQGETHRLLDQARVPRPMSNRLPDRIRWLLREKEGLAAKARRAIRMPWRR